MSDVRVEGSRFHWPAVVGIKELLYTKLVSIFTARTISKGKRSVRETIRD